MKEWVVTVPGGGKIRVRGPDDATEEQIFAFAKQEHEKTAAQIANDPISQGSQNFASDMPFLDQLRAGAGKAFADLGRGVGLIDRFL